ncbi:mRNA-decapping enzyme 1B-like [Sarcophilus harrisii]
MSAAGIGEKRKDPLLASPALEPCSEGLVSSLSLFRCGEVRASRRSISRVCPVHRVDVREGGKMAAVAAGGLVGKGRDISLAALQRHDPYINRIVDVASQVALYTFGHRANEWEKTDVEGTLFVYTRSASPKHGFTIMNRLSMENRTEPITKDLDFQLQDPFLLYRNARCES